METVKKANQLVEYSPDELLELKKSSEDPIYFIEHFVKIIHPVKGLVLFNLFEFQKEMILAIQNNRFSLFLNSRQSGKCVIGSTTIDIVSKPTNILKILILRIFFKTEYHELFK